MRRATFPPASFALIALTLGACRGSAPVGDPRTVAAPALDSGSESLASALLDTLAHHLARVEIERVEMSLSRTPDSPELAELNQRRAALCQKLREGTSALPSPNGAAAAVVLRTIEQRLAGLAVRRIVVEGSRTADSPEIRSVDAVIAGLERRRRELLRAREVGTFSPCL